MPPEERRAAIGRYKAGGAVLPGRYWQECIELAIRKLQSAYRRAKPADMSPEDRAALITWLDRLDDWSRAGRVALMDTEPDSGT